MYTSLPSAFRYVMPTEVIFGAGCFDQLADIARPYGKRAFIVTGRNSARAIGALDRALSQLPRAAVFDAVEENPGTETCERAAEQCRHLGCDFVVAIGGGSPIDVAKAVAALVLNPGPCNTYYGSEKLVHGALPIIAVPTTAGTGSETTPYAVIIDNADNVKRTITSKAIFPRVALLDPELTRPMPRPVTISTGLDALSQAMEGIVSRKATPVSDTLAFDVIRRVKAFLPRAARDGNDMEARSEMLYAAMLSGCVIAQTGTTLVHGMGYYYTLEFGIPHGLANGLLLTPMFQFNAKEDPDKVRRIVDALSGRPQTNASPSAQVAHELHALFGELETSPAAADHGVDETRLAGFAKDVSADPYRFRNQIGNITQEVVEALFRQSCAGQIL